MVHDSQESAELSVTMFSFPAEEIVNDPCASAHSLES